MRLNLYAATCSLLAYSISAVNLTAVDDMADFTRFAQTYEDEYNHDLAQTYSGISSESALSASDPDRNIRLLKDKLFKLDEQIKNLKHGGSVSDCSHLNSHLDSSLKHLDNSLKSSTCSKKSA